MDLAIGSGNSFMDPLIKLGWVELLVDVGEDVVEVGDVDEAGVHLEGIMELPIKGDGDKGALSNGVIDLTMSWLAVKHWRRQ